LSEVCVALGDSQRAPDLYEMLSPLADRCVIISEGVSCWGSVAHHLGKLAALTGDYGTAEAHFAQAIETQERLRARPFIVRTQYEYAKMLLNRGDRSDCKRARQILDEALATARELGTAGLEEKILSLQPAAVA
jgi:hypothetical protein